MRPSVPWFPIACMIALCGCNAAPKLEADVVGIGAFLERGPPEFVVGPPPASPTLSTDSRPDYAIGIRDHLSIAVWDRPDLGSQLVAAPPTPERISVVDADGNVTLPLVGSVAVAGRTLRAAEQAIGALYAEAIGLDATQRAAPPLDEAGMTSLSRAAARPDHLVGPLDRIVVRVWGREDLGSQPLSTVEEDGTIVLPFLGRVQVAGQTLEQLRSRLEEALASEVASPQLFVELAEARSRPVHLTGELEEPGTLYLGGDLLTLGEALAAAGGPTEHGARTAFLRRGEATYAVAVDAVLRGEAGAAVLLEAGDTLYLPPRSAVDPQVFVRLAQARSQPVVLEGGFQHPGVVHLGEDMLTVAEILSAAGLTPTADTRSCVLIRGDERYALDLRAIQEGTAEDVVLHGGDRVFVPATTERVVHVLGEVRRPAVVPIPPGGLTLHAALLATGGPHQITADTESIYLVRPNPATDRPFICEFELAELMAYPDLAARPGDTLYVPPTRLANWNRFWSQILPFVSESSFAYRNVDLASTN